MFRSEEEETLIQAGRALYEELGIQKAMGSKRSKIITALMLNYKVAEIAVEEKIAESLSVLADEADLLASKEIKSSTKLMLDTKQEE